MRHTIEQAWAPGLRYRKWLEMGRNGQGRYCINVGTGHPRWKPSKYVKGQRGGTGANSYGWSV